MLLRLASDLQLLPDLKDKAQGAESVENDQ